MDGKEEKVLNVVAPEGYEIDRENSTLECIKFRKKWNGPKFKKGDVVVDNFMEYLTIRGMGISDEGCKSYLVVNPYEDDRNARHIEREFVEGHYWKCTYPVFKAGDVLVKRHVGLSLDDTREELLRVICLEIDECDKYYYRVRTKNGEESIPYKDVDSFYYRVTEMSPSGLNGCKLDVGDIIRNNYYQPDEPELWRVVAVAKSLKSNDGIIYEIAEFHGGEKGARYKLGRKYVEEQFEKVGGVYYEKSEEEHKFKAGDTVRSREDGSLYIILSIEKDCLNDCYKYTPIYQVGRSVIYQSCNWVDVDFERVNDFCEDKDENYNRYYYLKKLQLLQSHLAHHNIATHVKVEINNELTSFSFADDNCFHTIYFGWYNSVKCEANFDHLLEEISKKYNFSIEDLKEWSER